MFQAQARRARLADDPLPRLTEKPKEDDQREGFHTQIVARHFGTIMPTIIDLPLLPSPRLAANCRLATELQGLRKIPGPVSVTVVAGRPDRRKRDLDNIATKAVLDLLTAYGVTDESKVVMLTAGWGRQRHARHHTGHRRAGDARCRVGLPRARPLSAFAASR